MQATPIAKRREPLGTPDGISSTVPVPFSGTCPPAAYFHYKERWKLELRGEFFNIMNHANWNGPSAAVNSATFGQVTGFGGPRLIQLSTKLYF